MTLNKRIFDLMEVKADDHDIDWLKSSLQAAVEVEMFTIPPYLSAMWSIKTISHFAYRSIKVIVKEEMLHLGLMCNLLTALGEVPKMNVKGHSPHYPSRLPGNINPKLTVALQGLSSESLETFMAIELPENGSVVGKMSETLMALTEEFSTLGAFYTAILTAFEKHQPALPVVNQLEDATIDLFKITDISLVRTAIGIIKQQGEGSNGTPEDTGPNDLAHYYRFGEIFFGKKLQKDVTTGNWDFNGDAIVFPDVFPMAAIPKGGYQKADVKPEVWALLEEFDSNYSTMLNQLQAAWEGGSLDEAVGAMFSLKQSAVALMAIPIPNGNGNYGPCFRLV